MPSDRELHNALLHSAARVLHGYEEYLLDEIDWRQLARVMKDLRKAVEAVDRTALKKVKESE